MDFQTAAPGGLGPGNALVLQARGADRAITIPPAPHFFRRLTGLVLAPVAGALVAAPTTLPLSVVEGVLGPAANSGGVAAAQDAMVLLEGILPAKYEDILVQLESEPAGVGLNPGQQYASKEHAAACVLLAVKRLQDGVQPISAAYFITAADRFNLEPMIPPPAAAMAALGQAPTGLTYGALEGSRGFFIHLGFVAFMCYGKCLQAFRDGPNQPSREFFLMLAPLAFQAGVGSNGPPNALVEANPLSQWLERTEPVCAGA